jgi:hypothetical protein
MEVGDEESNDEDTWKEEGVDKVENVKVTVQLSANSSQQCHPRCWNQALQGSPDL